LVGRRFGLHLYQKELGACHGDDLFYLFPFSRLPLSSGLKTEQVLITIFTVKFSNSQFSLFFAGQKSFPVDGQQF